jgi:hypothetical protein
MELNDPGFSWIPPPRTVTCTEVRYQLDPLPFPHDGGVSLWRVALIAGVRTITTEISLRDHPNYEEVYDPSFIINREHLEVLMLQLALEQRSYFNMVEFHRVCVCACDCV